jgi:hypothetical protein
MGKVLDDLPVADDDLREKCSRSCRIMFGAYSETDVLNDFAGERKLMALVIIC